MLLRGEVSVWMVPKVVDHRLDDQPRCPIEPRESRDERVREQLHKFYAKAGGEASSTEECLGRRLFPLRPRMFPASRSLQRPCLANPLLPRNPQRLWRNTFALCRPPSTPDPKSSVLTRALSTKPPPPSPEPKIMSTHAHTHFEEGNGPYVAGFEDKGKLAIPPAKHLAVGS